MKANMSKFLSFAWKTPKMIYSNVLFASNDRNPRARMLHRLLPHIPLLYITIRLFYLVYLPHEDIQAQIPTNYFALFYSRFLKENTLLWISFLFLVQYAHFVEFVLIHMLDFASTFFNDCLTVGAYLESNSIYVRHFIFLFPDNPGIIFQTFAGLKLLTTNNTIRKYKTAQRFFFLNKSCGAAVVLVREYYPSDVFFNSAEKVLFRRHFVYSYRDSYDRSFWNEDSFTLSYRFGICMDCQRERCSRFVDIVVHMHSL